MEYKEVIKEKREEKKSKEDKNETTIEFLEDRINEYEQKINSIDQKMDVLKNEAMEKLKNGDEAGAKRILMKNIKLNEQIKSLEGRLNMMEEQKMKLESSPASKSELEAIKECSKACKIDDLENMKEDMEELSTAQQELNDFFKDYEEEEDDNKERVDDLMDEFKKQLNQDKSEALPKTELNNIDFKKEEEDLMDFLDGYLPPQKKEEKEIVRKEEVKQNEKEDNKIKKTIEKEIKLNLNDKENVMKIINRQDFVEGFWDINDLTKIIKNKYENEFKLLKDLNEKNIDDIVTMTILIIYFINKEHKELLEELVMIIKKAKLYIQNKVNDSYENIIKKAGIN